MAPNPTGPIDSVRRSVEANPTHRSEPQPAAVTPQALPTSTNRDAVEGARHRPSAPSRPEGAAPLPPADETRRIQEWRLGRTAQALVRDVTRDLGREHRALVEKAVRYPVHELSQREISLLSGAPVSAQTRALVQNELQRVAVALRRRGDPATAAIAQKVADRMPATLDALGLKMLWDLTNRLPRAEDAGLAGARRQAPTLSAGNPEMIREAVLQFDHDGIDTVGYRFYLSVNPPPADESTFTADHQIEMGLVPPGPAGSRTYHFVDDQSLLNDATTYYVWATAYHAGGESSRSNVLHQRFPAAARGDVNRDGVIDTADVDKMVRILMGEETALAVADVDGDGWITQADLEALLRTIRNS